MRLSEEEQKAFRAVAALADLDFSPALIRAAMALPEIPALIDRGLIFASRNRISLTDKGRSLAIWFRGGNVSHATADLTPGAAENHGEISRIYAHVMAKDGIAGVIR